MSRVAFVNSFSYHIIHQGENRQDDLKKVAKGVMAGAWSAFPDEDMTITTIGELQGVPAVALAPSHRELGYLSCSVPFTPHVLVLLLRVDHVAVMYEYRYTLRTHRILYPFSRHVVTRTNTVVKT